MDPPSQGQTGLKRDELGGPPASALQFGIRWLMIFTAISAVAMGVSMSLTGGGALGLFAIAFFAVMTLIYGLMRAGRHSALVTVYETQSEPAATLCRDHLRTHGIPAMVVGGHSAAFPGMAIAAARVVVPAYEADRARRLLAGTAQNDGGPPRALDQNDE